MEIDKEFRDMMKENPRYGAFRAYEKAMDRINSRFGKRFFYTKRDGKDFLAEDLTNYLRIESFLRYFELEQGKLGFDKDGWKEWETSFEVTQGDKVLAEIQRLLVKPYPGRGPQLVAIRERKDQNIFAVEIYHPGRSGMCSGGVDYFIARTTDKLACGQIFNRYERKQSERDPN